MQIFEYTPGFVHAKVMVTDDCCGVVGSINLDYRSMFLHFEDAVLLYHDPTVLDIKRDFINTQFRSQPVTLEQCLGHSLDTPPLPLHSAGAGPAAVTK